MNAEEKEIMDMLNFDPIAAAEDITGERCSSEDVHKEVSSFSLGLHIKHNERKRKVLSTTKDTYYSMSIKAYIDVIESIGFSMILRIPFESRWKEKEAFFVFWRNDGILLYFDTFHGNTVNGGSFHYNWKPYNRDDCFVHTSSGGFIKDDEECIWNGYHDCREAVRHHIAMLEKHGVFINPWMEASVLHLNHHGDQDKNGTVNDKWNIITRDRILMMPKAVQKAMFPNGGMEEFYNSFSKK